MVLVFNKIETSYPLSKQVHMYSSKQNILSKFTPGIDQLWLIVILAGFLFYVSLIPLPPNDFWWHLEIGELIFLEKSIPTTNMFGWTIPYDEPFYYASWVGELFFYLLYRIGELEIIIFVRTVLAGVTFGLVGYLAKVKSGSWRIAAVTTTFACIMSMNNLPVRTQIWSWVPFVLFLVILNNYTEKSCDYKSLLFLPFIMIFWINAHGTFILGYLLLGIYCVGEMIQKLVNKNDALDWKNIFKLLLISLITFLVIVVNPRTIHITNYVFSIISNQPIQSFIEEWLPPIPSGIANITFFSSIIGIIIVFLYSTFKPKITETLLIIAFIWLAFNGQRSVIWYAIVTMPILARAISLIPINRLNLRANNNFINLLITLLVFIPVILVQPWFIKYFPLPITYLDQVILDSEDGPLLSKSTPIDATEYLINHPGGNLFHEMGYGSYLIWKIPDQGVFIDPRIELYPLEMWEDYIAISRGVKTSDFFGKYGITRIMLDRTLQKGLSDTLTSDDNWELEFENHSSQIWRNKNIDSSGD